MKKTPINILLVEDDDILSSLLQAKLESHGYRVTVVADGDAGLEYIHTTRPDLLLLDMMLPYKNGLAILEILSAEGILPALPVIIVSNSGQPVDIERAKRLGVRDWLVKAEIEPNDILSRVAHVVKEIMDTRNDAAVQKSFPRERNPERATRAAPIILLVEDDPLIAEMLRQKLSAKKYTVLTAIGEHEIDTMLDEHEVALVLLDVLLPDLNGLTILQKIKADDRYRDIPVLIISNLGQKEDIERGIAAGAAGYIVKANTYPDEIVAQVEALLEHKKQ